MYKKYVAGISVVLMLIVLLWMNGLQQDKFSLFNPVSSAMAEEIWEGRTRVERFESAVLLCNGMQLPVDYVEKTFYVPLNMETLMIILPYSFSLALVGLVETLLTSKVIDEMTDTIGDRNRECRGLGIANVVSGFFGGTCGCAMIAQAIVNVNSGGRGRLSNFTSGAFLMVLIFHLYD